MGGRLKRLKDRWDEVKKEDGINWAKIIRKDFEFTALLIMFLALVTMLLFILAFIQSAAAYPPLSTEIYGHAFIENDNVTSGDIITVMDQSNNTCGSFTVQNKGVYGLLTCAGDDSETSEDEGAVEGENLKFEINGEPAEAWSSAEWHEGSFLNVNISTPKPFCGDDFCDRHFEDSVSCPEDCDSGNATGGNVSGEAPQQDQDTTSTGGGGGGGGGGAGGGGGGAAGAITEQPTEECEENWNCTEWQECTINGTQSRTCTDLNSCGTNSTKPPESRECDYIPTCNDGVQNGIETDVDCGGNCPPCEQGESCEQNDDCTTNYCVDNVCRVMACEDPEIFCNDGMQTCDEEGVDCGGSCNASCPEEEQPQPSMPPLFVCEKNVNPVDNKSIGFFIIVLLALFGKGYHTWNNLNEIEEDIKKGLEDDEELPEDKELEMLKKKFSEKRKFWLFTLVLGVISIILYLYYYFFFLCESGFQNLWWLIILIVGSPFLIYYGLKSWEYSEEERIKKLRKLSDTHYRQIMKLIELENTQLEEMERELAEKMKDMLHHKGFRDKLDEFPQFKKIYKDMVELYIEYADNQTPYELERDLCQQIYELENDPHFRELAGEYEELKTIYKRLKYLYEQYEEKQNLYDQLDKIEQGWSSEPEEEEDGEDEEDSEDS